METNNPRIDREAPAFVVVAKWKSLRQFSRDTGYTTGTVYRWLVNGFIPGKYQAHIIASAAAAKPRVNVRPADFVDHRKPAAHAA